ncbi:MAG: type II toxin-antitoxin system Phd/YefM family antitoxin [Arenicella sp.]
MKLSTRIKPISYLKSKAADVLRDINEEREPYIITQNGEAKAVIQDIKSYEQTQETMALLKILALGDQDIKNDKTEQASAVLKRIRNSAS